MIWKICSLYDKGAAVFSSPIFVRHIAEAERSVHQAMSDPNIPLVRYAEQFSLLLIGEFDDVKGVLTPLGSHEIICQVASLLPKPKSDI